MVLCRKCSGFARCRLGPKQMNRCRPAKKDTEECGHMLKLILKFGKKEGCQDRNANGWNIEEEKRRVTGQECKRLREKLKLEGSWRKKKRCWRTLELRLEKRETEPTPLQHEATWLFARRRTQMPLVGETTRSDCTLHSAEGPDLDVDANYAWNPRVRVIIRGMEDCLLHGKVR